MSMDVPKSIAIIGEGETEWFYLRQSRTSDYIKRLVQDGKIEASNGWRKTYRLKKSDK